MELNIHERTVLDILADANGRVAPDALVAGYKQRFGIRNGRTRGVIAMIESCLLTLQKKDYLRVDRGGERATPTHRHHSAVGREVKAHKIGCCVPSKAEEDAMRGITTYRCAFFYITDAGRKALKDPSPSV
jgi:hypothetical protein